jgi:hypothetical protein
MSEFFGNVVSVSESLKISSDCSCRSEDGDGCVGYCYDTCDCHCEQYCSDCPNDP